MLGMNKPVIAMLHLLPLPGSSQYDPHGGMDAIIDGVRRDLAALQDNGIDAVMFGNEGDRPYRLQATPSTLAGMAAVIGAVKHELRVPFGVNYLWDPLATVALSVATGASFAREIFTGAFASDMGLWTPQAAEALELRAALGRRDLTLLFNINAEFATSLDPRPIAERARSAVFSSLADVILVSGGMTGQGVAQGDLAAVKQALPDTPVFANTGVTIDTVEAIFGAADGCVIGTHLKVDGITWNPVDGERVRRFMDCVRTLR